jgi:four helix bundle protein
MLPFERLNVYHAALQFTDVIYNTVKNWPREEVYSLTDQLKRASVSIALNIAEGTSRTKKDFRHFLDLSRGSCYECVSILEIAKNRGFVRERQYASLYDQCVSIVKMINGLRNSLVNHEQ